MLLILGACVDDPKQMLSVVIAVYKISPPENKGLKISSGIFDVFPRSTPPIPDLNDPEELYFYEGVATFTKPLKEEGIQKHIGKLRYGITLRWAEESDEKPKPKEKPEETEQTPKDTPKKEKPKEEETPKETPKKEKPKPEEKEEKPKEEEQKPEEEEKTKTEEEKLKEEEQVKKEEEKEEEITKEEEKVEKEEEQDKVKESTPDPPKDESKPNVEVPPSSPASEPKLKDPTPPPPKQPTPSQLPPSPPLSAPPVLSSGPPSPGPDDNDPERVLAHFQTHGIETKASPTPPPIKPKTPPIETKPKTPVNEIRLQLPVVEYKPQRRRRVRYKRKFIIFASLFCFGGRKFEIEKNVYHVCILFELSVLVFGGRNLEN